MKKFASVGALLLACALLATVVAAESSTQPPTNLKKVGDHWTPWDPPAAGPDDYIIEKGDTLWDLAEKWLGDPFLWPQIWDENRYVLDSHWIYPGDPLVVPGKPTVVPPEGPPETGEGEGQAGAGEGAVSEPGPGEGQALEPTPVPQPAPLLPVADAHDVYCSGYIEAEKQLSEARIAGRELERIAVGQGDVVYINQGRLQGVEPGSEWGIVRHTRQVRHPATGADLGTYVRRLGRVRVLAVQDETSIGLIEMACEDVRQDDELVLWQEIPIPRMSSMPEFDRYDVEPSGGEAGYVVAVADEITAVGEGHVIQIDLGDTVGVQPGEVLSLYRDNGELPRLMLGQAVILTVESGTSTVRITESVRESMVGDRVEVVR